MRTDGNWNEAERSVRVRPIDADARGYRKVRVLRCTDLKQVRSLAARGRAEGSDRTERAPEVDVGQQRAGSQQHSGSLRSKRGEAKQIHIMICERRCSSQHML